METELRYVNLKIPAELDELHKIGACLHELFDQEYSLPSTDEIVYNIELAIQEIAANIVQHAYAEVDGDIEVEIALSVKSARITIKMRDKGQSFEPEAVNEPELGSLQVHGYGLFLVNHLMDSVNYQNLESGNEWILGKNLPLPA